MYSAQLWLANGSWRPAHSLTKVLFRDISHRSLMTDCGNYMYFLVLCVEFVIIHFFLLFTDVQCDIELQTNILSFFKNTLFSVNKLHSK